jgi:penicillin-binding protein 2
MATELIGFKEGVIQPGSVIYDPGKIQVGYLPNGKPNFIKSWKTIGYADSYRALAESSNVYMISSFLKLAGYREDMPAAQVNDFLQNRLPAAMNKVMNYHKEFGMGPTTTGIDLPYEAEGQITREGYVSDIAFASIGQTENYTLLQLAQYVSAIANNGKRMQPHVVKEIIPPTGTPEVIQPVMQNQLSFAPEHLRAVQKGMYDVTNKPYGTFYSVFGKYPVKIAGKTGTAETGRGTEHSLFVGYAPYDDPQVAIAILIPDNVRDGHSSDTLGPLARAMFDAYFHPQKKKP